MPSDSSSPALSNDRFGSKHRKPFKKVVQDDSSSSSSSSSDSSSGSSNSSQSEESSCSSDGSCSVEVLRVERITKSPNPSSAAISEPELDQSLTHIGKSSFGTHGSKLMEATLQLIQPPATLAAVTTNASKRVDEIVTFDDEFPWFDNEAADYDSPSGRSDIVVVQSNKDVSFNNNFDGTDNFNATRIGPLYQSERKTEVDPVHYSPPRYHPKPPPIVHHLSLQNRPKHVRKYTPVTQLFKNPISALWKSKFDKFNTLQSEVSTVLVHTNDNVVVSAPTSAGKTAVFEMAMARHISIDLEVLRKASDWRQMQLPKCRKIVYISPSKALCEERYEDWSRRLSDLKLGISSAMITGDAEPGEAFRDIANSHIILTTPEKWDSLTRRWTENFVLFGSVKLILVDEVHLLGDACRGSCLESVLCRMKTIVRAAQACEMNESQIKTSSFVHTTPDALSSHLRIVAVSATLPNIVDIASFLDANEAFVFDDSYRPVPLTTHVAVCGDAGANQFLFNKSMNHKVPGVIRQFSKGKPTIIFCHTKKECEMLALDLSKLADLGLPPNNPRLAGQTSNGGLQRCLLRGVGYHNAGLDTADRKLVEKGFLEGHIKCLCATSTLAVGINLPAHLVIIKGTSAWRGSDSGYSEVDKGSILQMIGRAGRAGFDTAGTAVIMTESKYERKYKELGASLESVESQLLPRLVQVLNTEISQNVITTFQAARDWLATTFLFQSIQRKPLAYGVQGEKELEECLTRICGAELKKLDDAGCVEISKHQNGNITPLFACHVMNQHLVEFSAMKLIIEIPYSSDTSKLLATISHFDGVQKPVRRSEKKLLNEVHKLIKYKLEGQLSKVRVQEPHQKAFVLLQAAIGQHFFDDYTLRQEMSSNVEFSTRMLAATEDYSIYGSKNGQVALHSLKLRRSLAVSLWGHCDGVMNQLRGVGQEATGKLRFNNISSFLDVLNAKEDAIEKAAGRAAPFGSELRKAVYAIVRNSLKITAQIPESFLPDTGRWVACQVCRDETIPYDAFCDIASQSVKIKYTLIAFTDRPNGCLFYQANVDEPGEFRFRCPDTFGKISIHLVSSLVGLDEVVTIAGSDKICPPFSIPSNDTHTGKGEAQENAVDAQDKNLHSSVQKSIKNRIRDPANSVQAGFKRQAAIQKSTPQRSASMAVTPSPMPASASTRRNHRSAKSQIVSPKSITSRSEPKIPNPAYIPYQVRDRPQFSGHENIGAQISPLHQVALPIASRRHHTGPHDTDQAFLSGPNDRPRREIDVMAEASFPPWTKQTLNNCTKQSPRPDVAWKRQKREQRVMQQRAFRKEHENPFSKFQYDPNDAENNLDAITIESSSICGNGGSILPPEPFAKIRHSITAFQKGPTRLRSRKGVTHTRAKGNTSQAIPSHMVLRMKGEEQLRYSANNYFPRPTNPYDAVRHSMDSQTQEHQIHDIHSYGQATPMHVAVSPQPHWQPIWNSSQPTQLPYHALGPQIPQHMIQLGAPPMYGYSGEARQQHHMHEQGFDRNRVDYAEWGSSQGFQPYSVPGHSQHYPEYLNPSTQVPAESLLEDAFF